MKAIYTHQIHSTSYHHPAVSAGGVISPSSAIDQLNPEICETGGCDTRRIE